jgi:hypothetical protein
MALALVSAALGQAGNPPPLQVFYIPFAQDHQLLAFQPVNEVSSDPFEVFVTFSAATDGTVIQSDPWEEGCEEAITNPVQPSTLIFGDGNPSNGYPPVNPGDLIQAGTVFKLRNYVTSTNLMALQYGCGLRWLAERGRHDGIRYPWHEQCPRLHSLSVQCD